MDFQREKVGLLCTGGGAMGAYQVGVLKYIHKNFCTSEGASPFNVFSGVSCGAIVSTFYACHSNSIQQHGNILEELCRNANVPEYLSPIGRTILKRMTQFKKTARFKKWSLYDPSHLNDAISITFNRKLLKESIAAGTTQHVSVVATEVSTARPVWFNEGPLSKVWDRSHSHGRQVNLSNEHVIASCSIPVVFPAQNLNGNYYLDGGINIDRPLSGAISSGATKILVICTSQPDAQKLPTKPATKPATIFESLKMMLKIALEDSTNMETEQIGILNRFYEQTYSQPKPLRNLASADNEIFKKEFHFSNYRPVETLVLTPSKSSKQLYQGYQKKYPSAKKSHRNELLFHRDFMAYLIDLGYEEAKARHIELESFFQAENYVASSQKKVKIA